jgi:hypothetical protein
MMLKRISFSLALAAFILLAAAALRYAQGLEIISEDSARRTMQVMIGLILAAYANIMPKDIGPFRASARGATTSQSVLRVGGWSLTVAGLAYAGLWAFTPIAFADVASMVIVAAATLLTMAYGGWALLICRRTGSRSTIQRLEKHT